MVGCWLLASVVAVDEWDSASQLPDAECNIMRVPLDSFTEAQFHAFLRHRPFVLVGPADRQAVLQAATRRSALLANHGHVSVTLSSSNTFSYHKRKVPLAQYIGEMRRAADNALANETWYLFGDADPVVWTPILEPYVMPPTVHERAEVALSFGIGPDASGVQAHVHGAVWAETLHGRKRWILFEPAATPVFDPDARSKVWIDDVEQRQRLGALDCTLGAGELLWIPANWWHATINYAETVFISAFV